MCDPQVSKQCRSEEAWRAAAICSRSGSLFVRADNRRPDGPRVWRWLAPDAVAARVVEAEVVARPLPASRLEASDAAVGVVVAAAARAALPPRLPALQDAAVGVPALPLHLTVRWAKCRSVHCPCRRGVVAEEVAAA
jgi:hypothetical protein